MNTIIESLTKSQIIGRSTQAFDDSKTFEMMALDGRRSTKNQEHFRVLSKKYQETANLLLQLGMHWADY